MEASMEFPKYEKYKASGVEWLGEIPSHWSVTRNLGLFDERKEVNQPEMELLAVTIKKGVIKQSEITTKKDSSNDDKSKYKVVRKGDLAYNKMRMWQGAIGESKYDGIVSPAYIILNTRNRLYSRYFHYLYRTEQFIKEANRNSYGLCDDMNSLRYEHFKTIYSPTPPVKDVSRIIDFLDQKTAEIDAAIGKKQELIQLLNEQKAILINRAVTKGLNPNVKMKDSGVAWIGEIPEHWDFTSFKNCCTVIKDGLHHTPPKHEEGISFISTQHVRNRAIAIDKATYISGKDFTAGHPRIKPEIGDVLITLVGSIGFAAVIKKEHYPLSFTRHVGYVRLRQDKLNAEYLINYTESDVFKCFIEQNVSKTAQPSIYLSSLASHKLPVPPERERIEICEWLSSQLIPYKQVQTLIEQEIKGLQEFKQTLITHTTTGKIKV